ncbi:MAG: MAPEG family protein [Pseudomonadota bacterium]
MPFDITAVYAGVLGLWVVALAAIVGMTRDRLDVLVGDGGLPELTHKIRAHGNAVETIPLALILIGLAEGLAAPGWLLHLLGLALVVGRVLHGLYFLKGATTVALRASGIALTLGVIVLAALTCLGYGLMTMVGGA